MDQIPVYLILRPFHYLHVSSRPQAKDIPKDKEERESERMQVVNSSYFGS